VVNVDLFVPSLNFVFGLAAGNTAVISLARLRPEYYGEKKNEYLLRERALKESIHELGHTFGLPHCFNIRCIMHFQTALRIRISKALISAMYVQLELGGNKVYQYPYSMKVEDIT